MDPILAAKQQHPQMRMTIHDAYRTSLASTLPARPGKVAQPPPTLPSSSRQTVEAGYPYPEPDQVCDEKHVSAAKKSYHPGYDIHVQHPRVSPGTSVSSSVVNSVDLEKAATPGQSRHSNSHRSSRRARVKQEMAERNPIPHSNSHSPASHVSGHGSAYSVPFERRSLQSSIDDAEEMMEQRRQLEPKAVKILLYLSGPCAAVSFVLSIYALLATLVLVLFSPIRLCQSSSNSLAYSLLATLTSPQRLQLRLIYAPTTNTPIYGKSIASLLLSLLVSPFLTMGLAVAAWTVAIYWIFAAIVGDPDHSGGGDDGRATVLGLRGWWESWLERAVVQE